MSYIYYLAYFLPQPYAAGGIIPFYFNLRRLKHSDIKLLIKSIADN